MSINRRGMTLTEILIVLIILGMIAGFAIPSFTRTLEGSRMNEARVNLGIIHMANKVYRANNNAYWGPGGTTIAAINTNLNTDIAAVNYGNNVNVTGGANTYTATLGRNAGAAVDWVFTIDQTNTITCAGTGCPCGNGGNPPC